MSRKTALRMPLPYDEGGDIACVQQSPAQQSRILPEIVVLTPVGGL